MLKFLLPVVLAGFFVSAAQADEPTCDPYQIPSAELRVMWPGSVWRAVNPDYVAAIEFYMNNQNPVTDWHVTEVFIVTKGQFAALVLKIDNGCSWTSGPENPAIIGAVLKAALGDGA
jgi:hypothetical protein